MLAHQCRGSTSFCLPSYSHSRLATIRSRHWSVGRSLSATHRLPTERQNLRFQNANSRSIALFEEQTFPRVRNKFPSCPQQAVHLSYPQPDEFHPLCLGSIITSIYASCVQLVSFLQADNRNTTHVEGKNKGDTSNNRSDWDHFKIIQKIHKQHTRKP